MSTVTDEFVNRLGDDRNAATDRVRKLEAVLRWFVEHGDRATTSCPGACYTDRVEHSEYAAGQWCDCCRAAHALLPDR